MSSAFRAPGRRRGRRFDAEHNVVTEALIFLGELDPDQIGDAIEDATHYEPTPLDDFDALLRTLPIVHESCTFVDAGAGMGRVVMLASRYAFKQAIGIEVSRALCEVASDNLVRWRKRHDRLPCKDLRIKCADAAAAALPPGDLVVYLFNPFGERTLARFAGRLASETRGAVHVLYHTPVHRTVFDEHAAFVLENDVGFGVTYRKG